MHKINLQLVAERLLNLAYPIQPVSLEQRLGGWVAHGADDDRDVHVTVRACRTFGSAAEHNGVAFENGGYQVSYDREKPLLKFKPGDAAVMCLLTIPQLCPPGDDRGRFYLVTNTRTRQTWTLPDSEHMCGGA